MAKSGFATFSSCFVISVLFLQNFSIATLFLYNFVYFTPFFVNFVVFLQFCDCCSNLKLFRILGLPLSFTLILCVISWTLFHFYLIPLIIFKLYITSRSFLFLHYLFRFWFHIPRNFVVFIIYFENKRPCDSRIQYKIINHIPIILRTLFLLWKKNKKILWSIFWNIGKRHREKSTKKISHYNYSNITKILQKPTKLSIKEHF